MCNVSPNGVAVVKFDLDCGTLPKDNFGGNTLAFSELLRVSSVGWNSSSLKWRCAACGGLREGDRDKQDKGTRGQAGQAGQGGQ